MTRDDLRAGREALRDPSGDEESFFLGRLLDALEELDPETLERIRLGPDPRWHR